MKTTQTAKQKVLAYEGIYKAAISEIWDFDEMIAGVNIRYWLMSQVVQESRAEAKAKSPVGAMGFAQFMPETVTHVERYLKVLYPVRFKNGFDPYDIEQSIYAQVWYMNNLFSQWKAKRTDADRLFLALASYNAGLGNILKAQKVMNNSSNWMNIKKGLKMVTGSANSRETKHYVNVISDVVWAWDIG